MYTHTRNLGVWECYNPCLTVSVGLSPQSVRLSVYLSVSRSVRLSDNCFCFFVLCLRDSVLVCLILSLFLSNFHFANFSLSLSLSRFSVCLSLSVSLSLSLSLRFSLSLSLSLSVCLCRCLSFTMLFACLCWSVGRPACHLVRKPVDQSGLVSLPTPPSTCLPAQMSVCLCVCVSLSWHVRLSVVGCVSFCLPMHVHMWACLSVRFSPVLGGKGGVGWRIGRVEGSLVGLPVWLLLCLLDCSVCLVCLCNFCVQIFIWIHVRLRRRVHMWQGHVHVCQRVCICVHT